MKETQIQELQFNKNVIVNKISMKQVLGGVHIQTLSLVLFDCPVEGGRG